MILGVDEAGRGPWAGPLVVGAVVLPDNCQIDGLTDSKKLSEKRRLQLEEKIKEVAVGWGLGWVDSKELDTVGLSQALKLATVRAVEAVKVPYHEIVIDGTVNFLKDTKKGAYVTVMPKADYLVPCVSAASIIAKFARDKYMKTQDELFPDYGFASHVGYGTAKHRLALETLGLTPLHRRSFAPIAKLEASVPAVSDQFAKNKTAKSIGYDGEKKASEYLASKGFTVLANNWQNRWCEVDIVATKNSKVYFIEVKSRSSGQFGSALESITPQKFKQMVLAARHYVSKHNATSLDIVLAAVAIDGQRVSLSVFDEGL